MEQVSSEQFALMFLAVMKISTVNALIIATRLENSYNQGRAACRLATAFLFRKEAIYVRTARDLPR